MADNGLSISRGNGVNPLEKCTVQVGPAATRSSQEGRTLLQGLQPLDVWHGHAAELASPEVVVGVGESMSSTQIFDRDLSLSLPQTPNDLDHGQPLLLCQSPFLTGLDSTSWCYSTEGEVAGLPLAFVLSVPRLLPRGTWRTVTTTSWPKRDRNCTRRSMKTLASERRCAKTILVSDGRRHTDLE